MGFVEILGIWVNLEYALGLPKPEFVVEFQKVFGINTERAWSKIQELNEQAGEEVKGDEDSKPQRSDKHSRGKGVHHKAE